MRNDVNWRDSKLLDPFRGVFRSGKGKVNRLLHPMRREALRRRLERLSPVGRVLILCLGNICRSPYGAARLAQVGEGQPGLEVRSAGLIGPGRPSPENARSAARKRGVDLEPHISQLLAPELVAWAELLVVMDPRQGRVLESQFGAPPSRIMVLADLDPCSSDRREILDPFDRDEPFCLETYDRMDRCLEELFTLIRGES